MADSRGDQRKLQAVRAQALDHPIRLRIMELFTRNPALPLEAAPLVAHLDSDFPQVKVRLVSYHLAILRDAQLISAR